MTALCFQAWQMAPERALQGGWPKHLGRDDRRCLRAPPWWPRIELQRVQSSNPNCEARTTEPCSSRSPGTPATWTATMPSARRHTRQVFHTGIDRRPMPNPWGVPMPYLLRLPNRASNSGRPQSSLGRQCEHAASDAVVQPGTFPGRCWPPANDCCRCLSRCGGRR